MHLLILWSALFLANPAAPVKADQIVGKWMSDRQDLLVEVYKDHEKYAARIEWFDCSAPDSPKMERYFDTKNPNPSLRSRPFLGMVVVSRLSFNGKDAWTGGSLYDPNSGKTYASIVRLTTPSELKVRGFWGIELIGKDMIFHKVGK